MHGTLFIKINEVCLCQINTAKTEQYSASNIMYMYVVILLVVLYKLFNKLN